MLQQEGSTFLIELVRKHFVTQIWQLEISYLKLFLVSFILIFAIIPKYFT